MTNNNILQNNETFLFYFKKKYFFIVTRSNLDLTIISEPYSCSTLDKTAKENISDDDTPLMNLSDHIKIIHSVV